MRQATERDLRKDHLRDADPAEYEVREDGELVRKDRWEMAVREIAGALGWSRRSFEVDEVVDAACQAIEAIAAQQGGSGDE